METVAVIKFGGSASVIETGANRDYFSWFFSQVCFSDIDWLVTVIGGGNRVRTIQKNFSTNTEKDLAARKALWQHAAQLQKYMDDAGLQVTGIVPRGTEELDDHFAAQRLFRNFATSVSFGQPGQSTDTTAVYSALQWKEAGYDPKLVILSNVDHIYTDDPNKNPDALPIEEDSIESLVSQGVLISGSENFTPGMRVTIDPTAVSMLQKDPVPLLFTHANNIEDVNRFLSGKGVFHGTIIRE